jgi:hypothetical protein
MLNPYPENTGGTSHVRDCQLWAEIDYLDSPTDYREYLPGQESSSDTSDSGDLVMLETQNCNPRRSGRRLSIVVIGVITMLTFLLICGCFLHLFFDTL